MALDLDAQWSGGLGSRSVLSGVAGVAGAARRASGEREAQASERSAGACCGEASSLGG
jgi:hypothetical protein